MKFLNTSIALLGAIASMNFGVSSAKFVASPAEDKTVEDRCIVVMNRDATKSAGELQALADTVHSPILSAQAQGTNILTHIVNGFVTDCTRDEALLLAERPDVYAVYEDAEVKVDQDDTDAVGYWGLDRLDQEDLPLDSTYAPAITNGGEGVTAYIMDTGILLSHEDFEGRAEFLVNRSGDGQDTDCHGHGTHVAGTVGGKKSGVAKKVKLKDVKVLSCSGSGSYAGIIAAFDDILADHEDTDGPSTVNMSLGGGKYELLNTALDQLVASGVTVVVAAGNSNSDACNYSPASAVTAITVGSTTSTDARSGFSNFGSCVDIFAPGSGIRSSCIGSNTAYCSKSGTSMASPHVCGATALYLSAYPDATPGEIETMMERDALENKVGDARSNANLLLHVGVEIDEPVASPNAAPVAVTDAPVAAPVVQPEGPCLETFAITTDSCSYDTLASEIAELLADLPDGTCDNDAETELEAILGVSSPEEVQEYIASICNEAVEVVPFQDLSNNGEIFDKEYYDGGTYWNEAREYLLDSDVVQDRLKYEPGARIKNIRGTLAREDHITWPDYIDNFQDCELRAAQCCFVQDRQANDNNGNCDDPYDERCTDANPGDNTDICYTDMSRAPTSSRTTEGFAIFEDEEEDDSHCHGLAWAADASDKSARFKGNNLFFVSMFDHFTQRGYVRNVPGAPMCGCVEKMPVVTRSDCTQIDVQETAQFTYEEATGLQVEVTNFKINFNACQGANNNNNNLEAYYEQLVNEGKAEEEELAELREHLVGPTYCREAIDEFLEDQNIEQEPACPLSDPQDCGCMIVEQQDYRGTEATTVDGHTCEDWNLGLRNRYPDAYLESNYCRNPDGRERAWCYTDRATTGRSWQYCDVRECMAPLPTSTPSAAPSISAQPTGDLTETFNVALTGRATQSRTCYGGNPERAVDGNTNGSWRNRSVTHTCRSSSGSWWRLDLENKNSIIEKIVIYNRSDCCQSRILNTYVQILDEDGQEVAKDTITSAGPTTTFEYTRLIRGAAIKIYNERNEFISLAEVEVMGKVPRTDAPTVAPTVSPAPTGNLVAESINLARTGSTTQSCTGYGGSPSRAIDGNNDSSYWGGRSITHTCRRMNAFWQVQLASAENLIEKVVVWNRLDCCSERLSNSEVQILDKDLNVVERREIGDTRGKRSFEFEFPQRTFGKYVKVVLDGNNYLSLAEVEVFGKNLVEG